jgi:multiple sugar transport system ATP-binding protein
MTYAYCSNPGVDDVITCALEGDKQVGSGEALPLSVPVDKTYLFNAEGRAFPRLVALRQQHAA